MRRLILAVVAALTFAGCELLATRPDSIDAGRFIALYQPVADRHDDWGAQDVELDQAAWNEALEQSTGVRNVLARYMGDVRVPVGELADARMVFDRHDVYVRELVLDEFDRSDYLRSTDILRRMMNQAAEAVYR